MILLVIDTQNSIMNDSLYNFDTLKSNIKMLIAAARKNNTEVIFVRHNDETDVDFTRGKPGFEISTDFKPCKSEKILDKTVNSAFMESGLLQYLKSKNETDIIVVGLQTDYCIDATVKSGFEHGFRIIIPENTNSTFDNEYMCAEETYNYYNGFIWKNRYAECVTAEEAFNLINNS